MRVAVFAKGEKADTPQKAAGADIVRAEELADKINAGLRRFRPRRGLAGRGGHCTASWAECWPRLMPNPKLGTVTPNVAGAVKAAKAGSIEFRAEKAGIVHAGIGKVSFSEQALLENARAFIGAINKARPSGIKGTYINRVTLSSTMGPGVKVDLTTLSEGA